MKCKLSSSELCSLRTSPPILCKGTIRDAVDCPLWRIDLVDEIMLLKPEISSLTNAIANLTNELMEMKFDEK